MLGWLGQLRSSHVALLLHPGVDRVVFGCEVGSHPFDGCFGFSGNRPSGARGVEVAQKLHHCSFGRLAIDAEEIGPARAPTGVGEPSVKLL